MARGVQRFPMVQKFVTCKEQDGIALIDTLAALGASNVSELFSSDGETVTIYYACRRLHASYFRGVVEGITTVQVQHLNGERP